MNARPDGFDGRPTMEQNDAADILPLKLQIAASAARVGVKHATEFTDMEKGRSVNHEIYRSAKSKLRDLPRGSIELDRMAATKGTMQHHFSQWTDENRLPKSKTLLSSLHDLKWLPEGGFNDFEPYDPDEHLWDLNKMALHGSGFLGLEFVKGLQPRDPSVFQLLLPARRKTL